MTRKQERRRHVSQWAAIVLAGCAGGLIVGGWPGVAVAAAGLLLGHRRMILPPGVAVLTYHSVAEDPAWLPWASEIAVAPATFERHLEALAAMRATVLSTRDYLSLRGSGGALPARCVVLHFDDGYRDNWVEAVPRLKARGMPATFYASLAFVEPGDAIRPAVPRPEGYMNWPELRAIDADPLFEVEPHGIDHGRVPVSTRAVDVLTDRNWRRHAWVQWHAMSGPRHDWFRGDGPPAVPLGSPVPESRLALASPALGEDEAALARRIADHLGRCREAFVEELERPPATFCWPENQAVPEGRRIAADLGYRATTGGRRRNAADEPIEIISRIHMGDRALGFRWLPAEGLHLRAAVRLAQGNLYWYLVVGPMNVMRTVVGRFASWRHA